MALTNPHTHSDLGTLTIGGADITCVLRSASFDHSADTEDIRGACRFGALSQVVKEQGTLSASAYGAGTVGARTSHLDVSVLSIGGVSMFDYVYSIDISGEFDKQALPGIGVLGRAEGVVGKGFSGSIVLTAGDGASGNPGAVQALQVAAKSANLNNREKVLNLTINGHPLELTVLLTSVQVSSEEGQYQRVTIQFVGQAPAAPGQYPTQPDEIGDPPSLLELAIFTPKTPLAFTFTTHPTEGVVYSGSLTWDGWSFSVADGAVIAYDYTWKTFGNYTATAN